MLVSLEVMCWSGVGGRAGGWGEVCVVWVGGGVVVVVGGGGSVVGGWWVGLNVGRVGISFLVQHLRLPSSEKNPPLIGNPERSTSREP